MGQWEFSKKAGITRGLLSLIETGERTPPLDSIERMIQALGLSESHAAEFRAAAAMSHVPDLAKVNKWLEKYADERATAERRGFFMACALLKRHHPKAAAAIISEWTGWPDVSVEASDEHLQVLLDNSRPRRRS